MAFTSIFLWNLITVHKLNSHSTERETVKRFLQGKHTDPEILDAIRHGLRHRREINVELINYRKDGTPFWNHLLISPVFDKDGLCTHFIGTQQDITHQKEQEAQISYQATHDLLTGLPNAVSFQEALRKALVVCGKSGGSVGVLYLDLDGPHELLQFADIARDRAKRPGKNTWQWHSGQHIERSQHSVNLRHDLHAALRENQFEIHYQPLVDAVTGRMRSVEALVRWRHPDKGVISPGDFIPFAEQTGQIVPLGLWILKQACIEIAELNNHRERGLYVAVNISSLQFIRNGFLDDVRRILKETGLPPQLLELEVTESVLLDGAGPVTELMETLNNLGVRVALDDFGTGFSSLSYLRDLPTHKVKLDRSFVEKITTDRRVAAIVQGVITMAHHMDMTVVAEGIETRAQQEDLARRHYDILQGYLFGRPMPLAELKNLPDMLPAGPVT